MEAKTNQQPLVSYNRWEMLKKFPWKDLILGLAIPRLIFTIARSLDLLFLGAILSIGWCLCLLTITYLGRRKVNIFAIFALIVITLQAIGNILINDPSAHLILRASSYSLFGITFLCSLFWPRSLIEIFVDKSGAQFPESIKTTPYYAKAWKKLSLIWGILCFIGAAMLIFLKFTNTETALKFDIIVGWPFIALLFLFSAEFPRWYWKKYLCFQNKTL